MRVWTPEIQAAVQTKKEAFHKWKQAGRPENPTNRAVQEKKLKTISLCQAIIFEYSKNHTQIRQEILDSRTRDSKLFHKLINQQRGRLSGCINELYVGSTVFKSENEILNGWHQHLERLATPQDSPNFDQEYQKLVDLVFNEIVQICQYSNNFFPITSQEVTKTIKSLNTGNLVTYLTLKLNISSMPLKQ